MPETHPSSGHASAAERLHRILMLLAKSPGWVFSRYQIVNEVRGEDSIVTDRSVDVHITGLRKKLGRYGKYIETVRGVGYRFSDKSLAH